MKRFLLLYLLLFCINNISASEQLVEKATQYGMQGNHAECYALAHKILENNTLSQPLKEKCYDLIATSAWHLEKYEEGFNAIKQALATNPTSKHLLGNLALYVAKKRELTRGANRLDVLQTHPRLSGVGGVELHLAVFNKIFNEHNVSSRILTSCDARFIIEKINKSNAYGPPCILYNHGDYLFRAHEVIEQDPKFLICNNICHITTALTIKNYVPTKIIYNGHNSKWAFNDYEKYLMNEINGVTTVNPYEAALLRAFKEQGLIKTPVIEHMPPFIDNERFVAFKPFRSRADFFKQEFNLTIPDDQPVIAVVANLFLYKNHGLLLYALEKIIHRQQKKCHVIFAGYGPGKELYESASVSMSIKDYVHCVGVTNVIPELLYNSTLHLLPSYDEAFGIAFVEAAFMKKPFIVASGSGIEMYVEHGVNGFIFKNNDKDDLAAVISLLLENPDITQKLGENAYNTAYKEFSTEAVFKKWMQFLSAI